MRCFLDKQFEANLQANLELIAVCATLSEEQLVVEAQGIFGNIKSLVAHIVHGEGNALRDLSGTEFWSVDTDWDRLSLTRLQEMAKQSGTALRHHAAHVDPDRVIRFEDDEEVAEFKAWVLINQVIYHGIEHRTQIHALLTKAGVPHPRQDVWGFARSVGDLNFVAKSP